MSTDKNTASPRALPQSEADAEHYDVKVTALGERGDAGWVTFTHDQWRATAALHRPLRVDLNTGPVKANPCEASTPGAVAVTIMDAS